MRRDIADGAVQPLRVVPADPFEGFPFDLADRLPRAEEVDDLGLEQSDDAFSQGVVVAVADTAHGRIDAGFLLPLGVANGQVLAAAIRSYAGIWVMA